ncbi:MAG: hypothetical protein US66_C0010G0015 [Candidatus Moranbacteria bacterium GW2011_GWD2_37_9]|nr:MAG: hypothetical protein US66_C0010G0015 [Candidatus Moranbacteria bacterium GW2011_GWD2_37_9]
MKKIIPESFKVFLLSMALVLCFEPIVFAYETFLCTGGDFIKNIDDDFGECVLYVRYEIGGSEYYDVCNGYANTCYQDAQSAGYAVGQTPEIGAIMVINGWGSNTAGHVGIVIDKRNDNQEVKLRHSNWHLDGKVSEEWISVSQYPILGYIYCDGSGPSANENETYVNLRTVNGIGWYPPNKTCVNASQWYKTVDGKAIASYADNSACYLVGSFYINNILWQNVLFGTGDLPLECTQ